MAFDIRGVRIIVSDFTPISPKIIYEKHVADFGLHRYGGFMYTVGAPVSVATDPPGTLLIDIGDCSQFDQTVVIIGQARVRDGRLDSPITKLQLSIPSGLCGGLLSYLYDMIRLKHEADAGKAGGIGNDQTTTP